jgi:wyosine [tRNA(Phe)-imidazoG37] synthetase (radical SAM superfamily)
LTRIPVAVITNGSLLFQAGVREELMAADAVMPSLDAGSAGLFKKINRPHPYATFQDLLEGLTTFSREYRGRLWIEVMLVQGLNDTEEAVGDLAAVLDRMAPGEIHVNSPVRPPAEPWVKAPSAEVLARAASLLGRAARRIPSQITTMDLSGFEDVVGAILAVISRHPMTEEELQVTLHRWKPGDIGRALCRLVASGRAQVVTRNGRRFWTGAEARYGNTA